MFEHLEYSEILFKNSLRKFNRCAAGDNLCQILPNTLFSIQQSIWQSTFFNFNFHYYIPSSVLVVLQCTCLNRYSRMLVNENDIPCPNKNEEKKRVKKAQLFLVRNITRPAANFEGNVVAVVPMKFSQFDRLNKSPFSPVNFRACSGRESGVVAAIQSEDETRVKPHKAVETTATRKGTKSSHLGPVSKLLRRRHHTAYLATKSCDNIYSVNKSTSSLDWRVTQTTNEQGFQSRQSSSLDWRVGRSINKLHWRDTTRSAEQLSRSGAISSDHLQTPSTKSKLISLLRRLSPRLSRPGSKNSLQASPTICPWVQVEYSSESINDGLREDSQECDVSFQRELQLNELRKRMAGIPTTSQVTTKVTKDGKEQQSSTQIRIHVQQPENDCTNASKSIPYALKQSKHIPSRYLHATPNCT
ncbi:hypothetical protein E2986_13201 [Frieseomelitta varia]|uniref:Uncharacterized protein n=1 Tax=Frieseomelitta varia TaxID=561572 RepID=A0A833RVS1_9HYME|nr:hypothetical protein E2986_13201 [Frieseomelitta varia]